MREAIEKDDTATISKMIKEQSIDVNDDIGMVCNVWYRFNATSQLHTNSSVIILIHYYIVV